MVERAGDASIGEEEVDEALFTLDLFDNLVERGFVGHVTDDGDDGFVLGGGGGGAKCLLAAPDDVDCSGTVGIECSSGVQPKSTAWE